MIWKENFPEGFEKSKVHKHKLEKVETHLISQKEFSSQKAATGEMWRWVPNLPPYSIPLLFHKSFPNRHDLN